MGVIESPVDPRIVLAIDPTHLAARTSPRPLEHVSPDGQTVGGHYGTSLKTGSTTIIAAGGAILSLRLSAIDRRFALQRLKVAAVIVTAFTTAQELSLDLVKLTGFTTSDTGGTDHTPSLAAGSGRKRSTMAPSSVTDLRVATTAALGAGTGTADALPIAGEVLAIGNAVGSSAIATLFDVKKAEHPLVLSRTEGFRVRIGVTHGAVGVVRYTFGIDWAEVPSF